MGNNKDKFQDLATGRWPKEAIGITSAYTHAKHLICKPAIISRLVPDAILIPLHPEKNKTNTRISNEQRNVCAHWQNSAGQRSHCLVFNFQLIQEHSLRTASRATQTQFSTDKTSHVILTKKQIRSCRHFFTTQKVSEKSDTCVPEKGRMSKL